MTESRGLCRLRRFFGVNRLQGVYAMPIHTYSALRTLDQLRAQAEAELSAQATLQPARLFDFERQLADDKKAWRFSCRRHGDFLALFVTRQSTDRDSGPRELVVSVAIGKSTIRLIEGQPPNLNGTLHAYGASGGFGFCWREPYGYGPFGVIYGDSHMPGLFHTDPRPDPKYAGGNMSFSQSYDQTFATLRNAAQPATDDRIRFEAAGATLLCPQGLGTEVYAAILLAIGSQQP